MQANSVARREPRIVPVFRHCTVFWGVHLVYLVLPHSLARKCVHWPTNLRKQVHSRSFAAVSFPSEKLAKGRSFELLDAPTPERTVHLP